MQKLSNIISKQVYSFATGSAIGYVLNVALDPSLNQVEKLIVVDEETEQEAEVSFRDVKLTEDGVFISSEKSIVYADFVQSDNLLGKQVFTKNGNNLGKIKEIMLKNSKIIAFITNFSVFSPKQISLIGRDMILLGGKKIKKKLDLKLPEDSFAPPSLDRLVSVTALNPTKESSAATPYRISTDPNSLIGKMATKDIVGLNNELIIKKFEIITAKKINEAKKHNKLNLLFYNCK